MKDICVLIKNLKEVISWSKDINSNNNAEIDFSRPIFVTQAALEKEKKMFKERAAQTTQKEKEKGKSSRERKQSFRKETKEKDNRANQKGEFEKSKRVT